MWDLVSVHFCSIPISWSNTALSSRGLMGVSSSPRPSLFLWLHYLITALVLPLICTVQLSSVVLCTFVAGCNRSFIEAIFINFYKSSLRMFPSCHGHSPISFSFLFALLFFVKLLNATPFLSQTNMTTDFLGSGPLNNLSIKQAQLWDMQDLSCWAALLKIPSLLFQSHQLLVPPGEPALSCRVYLNLWGGSCLFFFHTAVYVTFRRTHRIWKWFYLAYQTKYHSQRCFLFPVTGKWWHVLEMVCVMLGGPHLRLDCRWHK